MARRWVLRVFTEMYIWVAISRLDMRSGRTRSTASSRRVSCSTGRWDGAAVAIASSGQLGLEQAPLDLLAGRGRVERAQQLAGAGGRLAQGEAGRQQPCVVAGPARPGHG